MQVLLFRNSSSWGDKWVASKINIPYCMRPAVRKVQCKDYRCQSPFFRSWAETQWWKTNLSKYVNILLFPNRGWSLSPSVISHCLPLLSILPPISKHRELVLANGKHLCGVRKAFAAMTACFTMDLCQHTAVISSTPWVFVCACVWSCGGRGSFDEMPWVKRLAELSGTCPSEDAARAPVSFLASHSLGEARF